MIEELKDFFRLYTADTGYLPNFWFMMILLFLNAGLYLVDLYHLVKRKSKAETRATYRSEILSLLVTTMQRENSTHQDNLGGKND